VLDVILAGAHHRGDELVAMVIALGRCAKLVR